MLHVSCNKLKLQEQRIAPHTSPEDSREHLPTPQPPTSLHHSRTTCPGLDYRRLDFTDQSRCVRIIFHDETKWQSK